MEPKYIINFEIFHILAKKVIKNDHGDFRVMSWNLIELISDKFNEIKWLRSIKDIYQININMENIRSLYEN